MSKSKSQQATLIGFREWVGLPDLGLPFVKAKLDTGARTSALHAFDISAFVKDSKMYVKFSVHPIQGRNDIVIKCKAPVSDYRTITDSGGHRDERFVILTTLQIGDSHETIEVTLANREQMSYRMLIGRSAMDNIIIDPSKSYLLGRPLTPRKTYKSLMQKKSTRKKATSKPRNSQ